NNNNDNKQPQDNNNVSNPSESNIASQDTNENKSDNKLKYFSVVSFFKEQFVNVLLDFIEAYYQVFVTPFVNAQKESHSKKNDKSGKEKERGRHSHKHRHHDKHDEPSSNGSHSRHDDKKKKGEDTTNNVDTNANTNVNTHEKSMAALTNFTRELFIEYFSVIKQCLQKEVNVDKLTEELQSFYDGLHKPSELVPNAKLRDRGTEIIEACIRTSMRREFEVVEKKNIEYILNYLRNEIHLNEECNGQLINKHVDTVVKELLKNNKQCLDRLVPLTTSQSALIPLLELNFDDQLWVYTGKLFEHLGALMVPFEFRTQQGPIFTIKDGETVELLDLSTLRPILLVILAKVLFYACNAINVCNVRNMSNTQNHRYF
ncbi:hypothetical protein RFI_28776, partial [Reticulomyxa filosa]